MVRAPWLFAEGQLIDDTVSPTGLYNQYDLTSYLIKALRIGDKKSALEVLYAMLAEKIPETTITRKLVQCASEDDMGRDAYVYATAVHDFVRQSGSDTNSLVRLILYLCDAPKFRQSAEGHMRETQRKRIAKSVRDAYAAHERPFEIPSYVYDRHTGTGKRRLDQGLSIDERVTGTLRGGYVMRTLRLRYGKLDLIHTRPEISLNPHLQEALAARQTVDQYLAEHRLTIQDILP